MEKARKYILPRKTTGSSAKYKRGDVMVAIRIAYLEGVIETMGIYETGEIIPGETIVEYLKELKLYTKEDWGGN